MADSPRGMRWVVIAVAVLFLGMVALLLAAQHLVQTDSFKAHILAALSQELGGEVVCQAMELSLLPLPHAVLHRARATIPETLTASSEGVWAYPALFPLLKGKVRIASLHVSAPDIALRLPEAQGGERPPDSRLGVLRAEIDSALTQLTRRPRGLDLRVDRGRLRIARGDVGLHWFRDIQGGLLLSSGRLGVELSCQSDLWERLSLEGKLNLINLKGQARVNWSGLRAKALTDLLLPGVVQGVKDSRLNASIAATISGPTDIKGEVEGSTSHLVLHRGGEQAIVRMKGFSGKFRIDPDALKVSLMDLQLAHPEMRLSGEFSMDRASSNVRLVVDGKEMDIASTREVALVLMGHLTWVQALSEILLEGKVSGVRVTCEADSPKDLCGTDTVVVKAALRQGKVRVPGAGLETEATQGEAVVSGGVLEARRIAAHVLDTYVQDASLRVGLKGDRAPFHLEASVNVDLSLLPSLLNRFVKDPRVGSEVDFISEIRGHAVARLVLGETLSHPRVMVEAEDFNLWVDYDRLPDDLEIRTGQFSYRDGRLEFRDLAGRLGDARFSDLTAQVELQEEPKLKAFLGSGEAVLDDIYFWLTAMGGPEELGAAIHWVSGQLRLANVEVEGPLLRPGQWRFRAMGELGETSVHLTALPGPVGFVGGRILATERETIIEDARATLLDTQMDLGGIRLDYGEGVLQAQLPMEGSLGPELMAWISQKASLPSALSPRPPLSLSQGQLTWDPEAGFSFSGELMVGGDRKVQLTVSWDDQEVRLEDMRIMNERSDAALTMALRGEDLDVAFKGRLDQATVDGLVVANPWFTGWVEGYMSVSVPVSRPLAFTARGSLRGENADLSKWVPAPLVLRTFSVEASEDGLAVKPSDVTFGDQTLVLEGRLQFSPQGIVMDVAATAEAVTWEHWAPILGGRDRPKGQGGEDGAAFPSLQGRVALNARQFCLGGFAWEPFGVQLEIKGHEVNLEAMEARLCGVSTPGTLTLAPQTLSFDSNPAARGQRLEALLSCLLGDRVRITGEYDLRARVRGKGRTAELLQKTQGDMEFAARAGRVDHLPLLSKLLTVLNVTEVLRGRLPDLTQAGVEYDAMDLRGNLKKGVLTVEEWTIRGPSLNVVCQGEIELTKPSLDLKAIVSIAKTVDDVFRGLPGVRHLAGDGYLSTPVRIRGGMEDPNVTLLAVKDVPAGLLGLLKRTAEMPFVLVDPLPPRKDTTKESPNSRRR